MFSQLCYKIYKLIVLRKTIHLILLTSCLWLFLEMKSLKYNNSTAEYLNLKYELSKYYNNEEINHKSLEIYRGMYSLYMNIFRIIYNVNILLCSLYNYKV